MPHPSCGLKLPSGPMLKFQLHQCLGTNGVRRRVIAAGSHLEKERSADAADGSAGVCVLFYAVTEVSIATRSGA